MSRCEQVAQLDNRIFIPRGRGSVKSNEQELGTCFMTRSYMTEHQTFANVALDERTVLLIADPA